MGFETPLSEKPIFIGGCETPAYRVPVNEFVANHPVTPEATAHETRIHSGELEIADLTDSEVAKQFAMLAGNCSNILMLAEDEILKKQACESVIETVIRLQNPEYATDQIEVRNEAYHIHARFEEAKGRMVRDGEVDIRELDKLPDPADVLLGDFEEYVHTRYDVDEMREQAALTLIPMIEKSVVSDFGEIAGVEVETKPPVQSIFQKIGAYVSRHTVDFKIA